MIHYFNAWYLLGFFSVTVIQRLLAQADIGNKTQREKNYV